MPDPRLDVLCIGNAIVDVIADADRRFLERRGAGQGLDAADRRGGGRAALRAHGPGARSQRRIGGQHRRRASRRSAGAPASSARSRRDQLGEFYRHDLTAAGVEFITPRGRRRRADRALDDPGHARRPPDDEHLPRRRAASAPRARSTKRRSRRARSSISKAICGTRRRRATRWSGRSRSRARPGARSPSPCPTPSASTATATASTQLIDERPDRHPVRQRGGDRGAGRRCAHLETAVAAVQRKVETLVVTRSEEGALAARGDERADVPGRADREAGRHYRRRRPVRRRLPARRGARAGLETVAPPRRDRRRRSDPALWRAPRGGPQGARRRAARLSGAPRGGRARALPASARMPTDAGASAIELRHIDDAAADMAAAAAVAEIDQQADGAPDGQHQHRERRQVEDRGRCSRGSPAAR